MIDQKHIRERLIKIIDDDGIRQIHIARKTGIIESNLSRFKNNILNLKRSDIERLDQYLKSKGY